MRAADSQPGAGREAAAPATMSVRSWRDADPAETHVLFAREQEYWVRVLAWDASAAWREIENARVTWGLPGFVAIDSNRTVRGWSYLLPEADTVHLGGLVADTAKATGVLLDACLEAARRPPRAGRVSCFLPVRAEGFEPAMIAHGFSCERYHYLTRPIGAEPGTIEAGPWADEDMLPAADLLREAYGSHGRHFAPRGTPEEWEYYLRSLVERSGCGVVEPAITRVLRGRGIDALVLVTTISPGTLHLAQVAVHPSRRRQGLARRLVEEACRIGAARGARQVTLLVGDRNAGARDLYARMGFSARAEFVAGMLEF